MAREPERRRRKRRAGEAAPAVRARASATDTTTPAPGGADTMAAAPGGADTTTAATGGRDTTTPAPGGAGTTTADTGGPDTTTPAPGGTDTSPPAQGGPRTRRPPRSGGYARSRAREERTRAALEPLAPGERPRAVTVAACVAALLAVANLVALATGFESDEGAKTSASLLGAGLCAVMAAGMWRARLWAVVGFEALLGISVVLAALALMTAVNTAAVILALAIVAGAGTLFWFLIKAMARLAMPGRPGTGARG